jgi:predicted dehydrogenase
MSLTFPLPRTGALTDAPALRWGILGTGSIADRFVRSLQLHTTQQVVAVASRTAEGGARFAREHSISRAHSSVEEMFANSDVDIVYVSTPNAAHFEGTMGALRSGKHVLVEKSIAMSSRETSEMVAAAESRGLFIMEGMWPRFHPYMDSVRQLIESGALGDPVALVTDLGEKDPFDPSGPRWNPGLGASVAFDRGIYLAAFSSFLMGPAASVSASGLRASTGIDSHLAVTLNNGRHGTSQLLASTVAQTPLRAFFMGARASLEFAAPWYLSPRVTLLDLDGQVLDQLASPLRSDVDALCYEAVEAARMVAAGNTGSPLMPGSESIEIIGTLERILESWRASAV